MSRLAAALSVLIAAGGCATAPPIELTYTQGSNLDLYASLADLGALFRVEEGCNGRSTNAVSDRWIARYYRRESAIRARLEREHGLAALEGADEINVHPQCGNGGQSHYWRTQYEAVLSMLEQRLAITSLQ